MHSSSLILLSQFNIAECNENLFFSSSSMLNILKDPTKEIQFICKAFALFFLKKNHLKELKKSNEIYEHGQSLVVCFQFNALKMCCLVLP